MQPVFVFPRIVCIIVLYMFARIYNILTSFLGESKQGFFDNGTAQYQFNCPECADENGGVPDNKYNLEVNFVLGKCHCWKCGYSGPISRLVKDYGGNELLKEYYAVVKDIKESKYYNIGLFKELADNAYLNDYIKLPETFTKIDLKTCRKKKLVEYLEKRHITQDIIDQHNIGYTTWDEESPILRNRIIIPSYDSAGDLNYWVGRDFTEKQQKPEPEKEETDKPHIWFSGGRPKYWNSKNDKNEIVFQESLIQWDANIVLVEGVFDALTYPNAISLLGKTLTRGCKLHTTLKEKANANIIVCLDGDTEIEETKRIYNILNTGRLFGKIWYIDLKNDSQYKDFGEIYEAEGRAGIIDILRKRKQFSEIDLAYF